MAVEIRGVHPDEVDDLIRAVAVGFGIHLSDRDLELQRQVLRSGRNVAAVDGEAFVGGATACAMSLSVPGAVVPAGGITGVAVVPTHRRRGILTGMMRRLLDEGPEPISILWAAEGSIYGRFGYGMATAGARLKLRRAHTGFRPGYEPSGSMRLVPREEALKMIPSVYDRVAAGQPGFIGQDEVWTDHRLTVPDFFQDGFDPRYFFAVHEGREGVDGYAAYRIKTDWEGDEGHTLKVDELVAENPGAYADLWRFVLDVDLVERVVAETRSPHEPLRHLLADVSRLGIEVHDGLWVRPVRVDEALAARCYATEGRIVLGVEDRFCPWNEGSHELVGGPDGATCGPTDAEPDLSVTAEDLGAAYLGGVSFRDLARAGRIQGRPEALARADAMFGWDPAPWCPIVF